MAKASRWLPVFKEFAGDLRIRSKNVSATDDRGVPLDTDILFLEKPPIRRLFGP
jgi:hypothetical protein